MKLSEEICHQYHLLSEVVYLCTGTSRRGWVGVSADVISIRKYFELHCKQQRSKTNTSQQYTLCFLSLEFVVMCYKCSQVRYFHLFCCRFCKHGCLPPEFHLQRCKYTFKLFQEYSDIIAPYCFNQPHLYFQLILRSTFI